MFLGQTKKGCSLDNFYFDKYLPKGWNPKCFIYRWEGFTGSTDVYGPCTRHVLLPNKIIICGILLAIFTLDTDSVGLFLTIQKLPIKGSSTSKVEIFHKTGDFRTKKWGFSTKVEIFEQKSGDFQQKWRFKKNWIFKKSRDFQKKMENFNKIVYCLLNSRKTDWTYL